MNIIAIVQARMASARLPGKVLFKVLNRPILSIQLERIRQVRKIEKIVIATTTNSIDDPIEELGVVENISVFRGDEHDVLGRFQGAAEKFDADAIVRLTGDCPLIDPEIVDHIINIFKRKGSRLRVVTNAIPRSYPAGLDTECFDREALELAVAETIDPYDREHVTPYFYKNPNRFCVESVVCDNDLSAERWTLDEASDFDLIKKIIEDRYSVDPFFRMKDILDYLDANPELRDLNNFIQETPRIIEDRVFGATQK